MRSALCIKANFRGLAISCGDVEFLSPDACPELASDWSWLESRANGSPFTSWTWVSTWLKHLPDTVQPMVCRVRDGQGLVALGLTVGVPERGFRRIFGGHSIRLQETGDAAIDEVTPEYVGLLVRKGSEVDAYAAFFDAVSARCRNWRRIQVPATSHGNAIQAALPDGLRAYSTCDRPAYTIDLAAIRASGRRYVDHLSKKTRSNLAQVRRAYGELGALRVDIADTPERGLEWLEGLRQLHERRWESKGQPGSFASPYFRAFHRDLVAEGVASGFVDLIRVTAGDLIVGYLHVLQWRGGRYYYNSGFNYGALERYDSPGIAALHAVVEHGIDHGWTLFDFLAGEQDYKRRLSTGSQSLHWIDVRRAGPGLAAEGFAWRLLSGRELGVPLGQALAA